MADLHCMSANGSTGRFLQSPNGDFLYKQTDVLQRLGVSTKKLGWYPTVAQIGYVKIVITGRAVKGKERPNNRNHYTEQGSGIILATTRNC